MITKPPKKINYLSNKNLLHEISRSKATYCSFLEPQHQFYDAIVAQRSELTLQKFEEARAIKARPRGGEKVAPETIPLDTVVIRLLTPEHIPAEITENKHHRATHGLNFPPFKHYIWRDGAPQEVLRSHWKDGLANGHFSDTHGKMTPQLARALILLTDRIGSKGNFRGYTYLEDMKGSALMQLSQVGLQFNELKSDNPFAFYTRVIQNSFIRVLNNEKKVRDLRDDILQDAGAPPSSTRQGLND